MRTSIPRDDAEKQQKNHGEASEENNEESGSGQDRGRVVRSEQSLRVSCLDAPATGLKVNGISNTVGGQTLTLSGVGQMQDKNVVLCVLLHCIASGIHPLLAHI